MTHSDSLYSSTSESTGSFSIKHLASTLSVLTPSEASVVGGMMSEGISLTSAQEDIDELPEYFEEPISWDKKPRCEICFEDYKLLSNREHHWWVLQLTNSVGNAKRACARSVEHFGNIWTRGRRSDIECVYSVTRYLWTKSCLGTMINAKKTCILILSSWRTSWKGVTRTWAR